MLLFFKKNIEKRNKKKARLQSQRVMDISSPRVLTDWIGFSSAVAAKHAVAWDPTALRWARIASLVSPTNTVGIKWNQCSHESYTILDIGPCDHEHFSDPVLNRPRVKESQARQQKVQPLRVARPLNGRACRTGEQMDTGPLTSSDVNSGNLYVEFMETYGNYMEQHKFSFQK